MKLSVVALALAACSGSSSAPKAPADKPGRAQRFQIGTLEAYALDDGDFLLPNDGKGFGLEHPVSEIAELLAAVNLPRETIMLDIQCLLVKAGDRVILFDTGTGDETLAEGGRLPLSLALAGVAPIAVTDIFISHAHGDHIGGLARKAGVLSFPAATIHMSAPEWASLQTETDDTKRVIATIAPKISTFEPGALVLPIVKAVATPGHTPGHSSYEIGTDPDKLFYLGDIAHHSIISLQRPAWSVEFDKDHAAAEAMRQQTLAKLAAAHTRVFAVHFPFMGVGQVVAQDEGFGWKPESAPQPH